MKRMSRVLTLAVVLTLAIGMTFSMGAPEAQAQETWSIALEEIEGSVQDAWAQEFKRRVEEETDGEVEVTVYPYGTIGTGMGDLAEAAQTGIVEFSMTSPSVVSGIVPEARLFSLHYLWPDDQEIVADVLATSEAVHGPMADAFNESNLELLSLFPEGWQVWTANEEIRTPEDMDGFQIRVMPDPVLSEQYRNYGADPVQMDYDEVYSGLQLGMIDGQVNPVFAIEEMNFYEQQDYMIWGYTVPYIGGVSAGQSFWEGLSEERREMVRDIAEDLNEYIYEVQSDYNEERMDIILENEPDINIIELEEDEIAQFRELAQDAYEVYFDDVGEVGEEMLEILQQDIEDRLE
ncbi:TRAP transporter substrate-binding protein DctP [Halarsenatibacter silvermanii]|uniref:TRAP-type C4-dicarboxylate transport system, substrate-binding protein n=1 Tax=Halarsenatibacter silvermanii TaxID=321763 RepID=A0A1G9GXD4_9FIRM|nr:TRAP transporter substrate-binding protein DctP [Halarsenatibacter silvermanii]SDL05242.1 TRAP-type C4-dicarboxylate transport system, substrate-binding protein [Halarsenatibacter silvermanii]